MSHLDDLTNEINNKEQLLKTYIRRLNLIREQIAYKGRDASPGLLMEDEDLEKKINELRQELADLRKEQTNPEADNFIKPQSDISPGSKPARHKPGDRLSNRYKIKQILDIEAIDSVYLADDTHNEYEVAIKQFNTGDLRHDKDIEKRRDDFERKANEMKEMEHPNIVEVRHVFTDKGSSYYVMRYMPTTLYNKLSQPGYENGMSYGQASKILKQICEGLDYSYQKFGRIHGHINPGNILLDNSDQPKITNFGASVTKPNIDFVRYLAPEQIDGGRARPETDIYALGVLFYKLLTGRNYDPAENLTQSFRGKNIPKGIIPIIRKALSKNPTDRYANAGAMLRAVNNLRPADKDAPPNPRQLIMVGGIMVGGIIVVLLLIRGGIWYFQDSSEQPTPTITVTTITPSATPTHPTETPTPTVSLTPTLTSTPSPTDTPTITPIPTTPFPPDDIRNILSAAGVLVDGKILVGVRFDAPPYGLVENWLADDCNPATPRATLVEEGKIFNPQGYDISIARELALRWLKDPEAVEFRCVPVGGRLEAVHELGLIGIFSLSKTDKRCIESPSTPQYPLEDPEDVPPVWCSERYMLDGQGVLTYKNSGIDNLCDVRDKVVTVSTGTTAESHFKTKAELFCGNSGLELNPLDPIENPRPKLIGQVSSKQILAYATNVEILNAYATNNNYDNLFLVPGKFGPGEDFVIAVKPVQTNLPLLEKIDEAITEWRDNGTLERLMKEAGFKCVNTENKILQGNLCGMKPIKPFTEYPLQPGDTLGGIAIDLWGQYKLWPCIAKENSISTTNPVIPDIGTLKIPARPNDPKPDADPDFNPDSIDCTPMP